MNDKFPRHPAVRKATQGAAEWPHERDNEWLAANPHLVPKFENLLWSAARRPVVEANWTASISNDANATQHPNEDPFGRLPRELADAILSFLDPVDVASLRLASCARYLPLSDWRSRLGNDMPWLWEVWDDEEPSLWASVSHADVSAAIKAKDQAIEDFQYHQSVYITVIQEEMPEI